MLNSIFQKSKAGFLRCVSIGVYGLDVYETKSLVWIGRFLSTFAVLVVFLDPSVLPAAETYVSNASSNIKTNYSTFRGFTPTDIDRNDANPDNDGPSSITNTPCVNYPTCMDGSMEFGQYVPTGSSNFAIMQCSGKNDKYGDTCSSGVDLMQVSPATPDLTRIAHALASSSTTGGILPFLITGAEPNDNDSSDNLPSDGWIRDQNDDPVDFRQQSFNQLVSRAVTGLTGSDCNSMSAWNDNAKKRCNEMDFSTTQRIDNTSATDTLRGPSPETDFRQEFEISFSVASLTDEDGNLVGDAEGSWTVSMRDRGGNSTYDGERTCTGSFSYSTSNGFVVMDGTSADNPCGNF